MLSGHLQEKGGKYYAVLNCKHRDGKRFPKWVSTGLPAKKGTTVVRYHANIHKALEGAVENELVLRHVAHI